MTAILSVASIMVLLTILVLATRWGNVVCTGSTPVSLFTFMAVLFTSGLDVGLIMFPLVDFQVYAYRSGILVFQPARNRIWILGLSRLGLLFSDDLLLLHRRTED